MRDFDAAAGASEAAILRSGLRFLREFAAQVGWSGVVGAASVCASSLLENVGVVLLVPLLSVAIGETGASGVAAYATPIFGLLGAETRTTRLGVLLLTFAALILLRAAANGAQTRLLARIRTDYVESHRARLLHGLAASSWERVLDLRHARLTQAISGDVAALGGVMRLPLEGGAALALLAGQCLLAFLLAPAFAAICLALLVLAAFAGRSMLRGSYRLGAAASSGNLALTHSLGQFLGGLKLAIGQNLQSSFVGEFEETLAGLKRRHMAFLLRQSDSQNALTAASGLIGLVCAFVGLGLLDMPAPLVFGLLLLLARIGGPAQQLVGSAQQFVHSLPAWERIRAIEDALERPAPRRPTAPSAPLDLDAPVVFRDATFRHGARAEGAEGADGRVGGVTGVSLEIAPGEMIGVAGPSGAGKTTFADLLIGLVAPQSGMVAVAETPLAGPALAAWRDALAYVAQDSFLFHDSLRRNLLWGASAATTEEEIWRALALVGADAWARHTPAGLGTIVGERGALLSGGERQRFALARAILRKPHLLVLDEATSALDIASEREILARLAALDPAPTIVIVAHRRESLATCGRLLTFVDGRLDSDVRATQVAEIG
jgi:ATP-binding cassette subfamily C protein